MVQGCNNNNREVGVGGSSSSSGKISGKIQGDESRALQFRHPNLAPIGASPLPQVLISDCRKSPDGAAVGVGDSSFVPLPTLNASAEEFKRPVLSWGGLVSGEEQEALYDFSDASGNGGVFNPEAEPFIPRTDAARLGIVQQSVPGEELEALLAQREKAKRTTALPLWPKVPSTPNGKDIQQGSSFKSEGSDQDRSLNPDAKEFNPKAPEAELKDVGVQTNSPKPLSKLKIDNLEENIRVSVEARRDRSALSEAVSKECESFKQVWGAMISFYNSTCLADLERSDVDPKALELSFLMGYIIVEKAKLFIICMRDDIGAPQLRRLNESLHSMHAFFSRDSDAVDSFPSVVQLSESEINSLKKSIYDCCSKWYMKEFSDDVDKQCRRFIANFSFLLERYRQEKASSEEVSVAPGFLPGLIKEYAGAFTSKLSLENLRLLNAEFLKMRKILEGGNEADVAVQVDLEVVSKGTQTEVSVTKDGETQTDDFPVEDNSNISSFQKRIEDWKSADDSKLSDLKDIRKEVQVAFLGCDAGREGVVKEYQNLLLEINNLVDSCKQQLASESETIEGFSEKIKQWFLDADVNSTLNKEAMQETQSELKAGLDEFSKKQSSKIQEGKSLVRQYLFLLGRLNTMISHVGPGQHVSNSVNVELEEELNGVQEKEVEEKVESIYVKLDKPRIQEKIADMCDRLSDFHKKVKPDERCVLAPEDEELLQNISVVLENLNPLVQYYGSLKSEEIETRLAVVLYECVLFYEDLYNIQSSTGEAPGDDIHDKASYISEALRAKSNILRERFACFENKSVEAVNKFLPASYISFRADCKKNSETMGEIVEMFESVNKKCETQLLREIREGASVCKDNFKEITQCYQNLVLVCAQDERRKIPLLSQEVSGYVTDLESSINRNDINQLKRLNDNMSANLVKALSMQFQNACEAPENDMDVCYMEKTCAISDFKSLQNLGEQRSIFIGKWKAIKDLFYQKHLQLARKQDDLNVMLKTMTTFSNEFIGVMKVRGPSIEGEDISLGPLKKLNSSLQARINLFRMATVMRSS